MWHGAHDEARTRQGKGHQGRGAPGQRGTRAEGTSTEAVQPQCEHNETDHSLFHTVSSITAIVASFLLSPCYAVTSKDSICASGPSLFIFRFCRPSKHALFWMTEGAELDMHSMN